MHLVMMTRHNNYYDMSDVNFDNNLYKEIMFGHHQPVIECYTYFFRTNLLTQQQTWYSRGSKRNSAWQKFLVSAAQIGVGICIA